MRQKRSPVQPQAVQIPDPFGDMDPAVVPTPQPFDESSVSNRRKRRAEKWNPELAPVRMTAKHQVPRMILHFSFAVGVVGQKHGCLSVRLLDAALQK